MQPIKAPAHISRAQARPAEGAVMIGDTAADMVAHGGVSFDKPSASCWALRNSSIALPCGDVEMMYVSRLHGMCLVSSRVSPYLTCGTRSRAAPLSRRS